MDFNGIFKSRGLKITIAIIGCLIILLLVFKVGEFVGYNKANFSLKWAENYHRNFGGPNSGFGKDFPGPGPGFASGHGFFGTLLKVDGDNMVVQGPDNIEQTISVSGTTTVMGAGGNLKISDLKIGSRLDAIGTPDNQGNIQAKFVRVFP